MANDNYLDFYLHKPTNLSGIENEDVDWRKSTNDFSYFSISNSIDAFGVSNEEKRKLIETICKDAIECNKTLESIVHDMIVEKYVHYGGDKNTIEAILSLKIQKIDEKFTYPHKKISSKKKGGNSVQNAVTKRELQHGVEYPVFSKGPGVTDDHIKALYRKLTARGWISTQTKEADFLRLFSGNSNDCEIIWTGQDKLGDNNSTKLGVSALYVLFKNMFKESLITTSSIAQKVGPILEMHFVDNDGHFLTNVSNVSTTSAKAVDNINQILKIMKTRLSSEDIQRLLEEDMESKFDKNDRQDLNYRKRS